MRVLIGISLVSVVCNGTASAEERCVAGEYRLPESIAEEMRPYLVCGLFRERNGHFSVRLNGQSVSMRGHEAESCGKIRQAAVEASETRLVTAMPDVEVRRSFVSGEFEKADRFLQVAAKSVDLAVGEEPVEPQCRASDASNR